MTYESLVAGFRLRVLKTEEDYAAAKAFWEDEVSFVLKHCKMADSDGVEEYSEVLTLLMALYEKPKPDEYDEGYEERGFPEDKDWVTDDYVTFEVHSGYGVVRVPLGGPWQLAVKDRIAFDKDNARVWFCNDMNEYELLSLEDDE